MKKEILEKRKRKFIAKAKAKFKDKFSYDKVVYNGNSKPVVIVCKKHGDFNKTPGELLEKEFPCKKCRYEYIKEKGVLTRRFQSGVIFITKARMKHGQKFDYSLVEYEHSKKPVLIKCPIHGIFKQCPSDHLNNVCGCTDCGIEKARLQSKERTCVIDDKKKCNSCNKWLNVDSFRKIKRHRGRYGLDSNCIKCSRKRGRSRAKERDKNAHRKSQNKYYQNNKKEIHIRYKAKHKKIFSCVYFLVCECGDIEVNKSETNRTKCRKCHSRDRAKNNYKNNYKPVVLLEKQCSQCRAVFTPKKTNGQYLCDRCSRINSRSRTHKKRAEKYGVHYEVVYWTKVYKRDKYRCQICGIKTIKPTGKNLPNEWTAGHILPMCKGGGNNYANAQCECRACNNRKGTNAEGQQLSIFYTERSNAI